MTWARSTPIQGQLAVVLKSLLQLPGLNCVLLPESCQLILIEVTAAGAPVESIAVNSSVRDWVALMGS
jgi:hypothetical protein